MLGLIDGIIRAPFIIAFRTAMLVGDIIATPYTIYRNKGQCSPDDVPIPEDINVPTLKFNINTARV